MAEDLDEEDFALDALLDAALGLTSGDGGCSARPSSSSASAVAAAGGRQHQQHQQHQQLIPGVMASPVTYDHMSPSASPCASPLHAPPGSPPHCTAQLTPGSPAYSSSSMQAFLPASQFGMYSPVRECRSPPVPQEQLQESHAAHVHAAATAARQQQRDHTEQQQHRLEQQQPHASSPALCFSALPHEVQMRVVCCLSADALTSLAQVSTACASLCSEPLLWRRLFCFRWGKGSGRQTSQLSWKARYMERDLAELRAAAGAGDPQIADAMQAMFVQAHLAKRQQALGRAAVDDLMLVDDDEVAARVMAWRKSRGFDGTPAGQAQRPADLSLPQQPRGRAQGGHGSVHHGSGRRPAAAAAAASRRAAAVAAAEAGRLHSSAPHAAAEAAACAGGGSSSSQVQAHAPAAAVQAFAVVPGCAQAQRGCSAYAPAAAAAAAAGAGAATSKRPAARAAAEAGEGHRRVRQRRRWTQIGNTYCDELSGWVHVCDETCSEKILEPSSGLLVCPISGSVFDRMVTCAEEAADEADDDDAGRCGADEECGERGRLARAFAAGYYADDEQELLRECGVRLSR